MKAITVSQPYASLLLTPEKWVENRGRNFTYRGPLLIHAGKGLQYLTKPELENYPTGMILGVCELVNCLHLSTLGNNPDVIVPGTERTVGEYRAHLHTEGPYCLLLEKVRAFWEPIPYRGAQGLFDVPDSLVAAAIASAERVR